MFRIVGRFVGNRALSLYFCFNTVKCTVCRYVEDLTLRTDSRDDPVVKLALFGVGRAGTIHLMSIISSPRVKLLYIVDDIERNWEKLERYWHLEDVIFLNSKQSDRVYEDPE